MKTEVLPIKGVIASMPKEDQEKIFACYDELKQVVDKYKQLGTLAFTWLGSELANDK